MSDLPRYCCCAVVTSDPNALGIRDTTVFKCWPRAMDMGHCADSEHALPDGTVPKFCCKSGADR